MTFELYPFRLAFTARDALHFPAGQPGNILRGAFGAIFRKIVCMPECRDARTCERRFSCAYARVFEPAASGSGPSGLRDWPRPFVFRATHLDERTLNSGESFHFDLNLFAVRDPVLEYFVAAFSQLVREGLGPQRGRADLTAVWQLNELGEPATQVYDGSSAVTNAAPLVIDLAPARAAVDAVVVRFLTPTELKGAQLPEFSVLFSRIRDRLSTLRALYGSGPLEIDFRRMGERAAAVRMTRCETHWVRQTRRSSRTGRVHPLGGFIGEAEYTGELAEFVPYLQAARWTGVGRQTVWGKGQIEITAAFGES